MIVASRKQLSRFSNYCYKKTCSLSPIQACEDH